MLFVTVWWYHVNVLCVSWLCHKPQRVCTRRNYRRREFALQSQVNVELADVRRIFSCCTSASSTTYFYKFCSRRLWESEMVFTTPWRCLLKPRWPYTALKLDDTYPWLYSLAENEINEILFDFQVTYKRSVIQQTSAMSQFFLRKTTFYCSNRFRQISWNDYPQMWVKSWNSSWTVHCATTV